MQSIGRFNLRSLWMPWGQSPSPQLAASGPTVAANVQENYGWIIHPYIDLIFVCGGLVWIFVAVAATNIMHWVPSKATEMLNFAFFLIFVVPHGMATFLRVYDVPATRKESGMKVALLAAACCVLVFIGCSSLYWASVVARLALCFAFQHGLGQAYGIALVYCYKRKFYLSKWEKRIFSLVIQTGILVGVAGILGTYHLYHANTNLAPLFPASFPPWIYRACDIAFGVSVAAFCIMLARKYFVEKQLMPLPALLTIATGIFLFVLVIPKAGQIGGLFIVLYYTAHGLFHTPQYLAVTTAVHLKSRGWPQGLPFSKIASQLIGPRAIKYFVTLNAIGWIYLLLSVYWGPLFHRVGLNHHPELWYLVTFSTANLHHYWTDAIVWKLKDKENLRLLIN